MTKMNKTVAEKLRNIDGKCYLSDITHRCGCPDFDDSCSRCVVEACRILADMIEAEQAELRNQSVDVAALELLCDKLECGDANHRATAAQIRKAMNGVERSNDGVDVGALLELANKFDGYSTVPSYESFIFKPQDFNIWSKKIRDAVKNAKPQLPEGIEWPRFTDGELVKFGDEINVEGVTESVTYIGFYETHVCVTTNAGSYEGYYKFKHGEPVKRPEPEVLDADGVPIKVGDTVYGTGREKHRYSVVSPAHPEGEGRFTVKCEDLDECEFVLCDPRLLTHRKPDTVESVARDMAEEIGTKHAIELRPYIDRLRKLMGGE